MIDNNFTFQPLRIRAYLQAGVISDQFLPLDGLVYAQLVREKIGEQYWTLPSQSAVGEGIDIARKMPFQKAFAWEDFFFYKCSFAQWHANTIEDQQTYSKRFDLHRSGIVDFGKNRAIVDTQRGQHKAYHVKVYYRHAPFVEWYADGDKQELERLLSFCTHIGKKASQGWGAVKEWEVKEWAEDWSVRGHGNKLMRAVPVRENGFLYGIRPSYWLPKHQFPCKMPEV